MISQDTLIYEEQETRPSRSGARAARRRHAEDLAALAAATGGATDPADNFFENARDEYIASMQRDVEDVPESVQAISDILHTIMGRSDADPGLGPNDLAMLDARGVYGPPAIALAFALPKLCKKRGHSCGLRLFDERHLAPNPERPKPALMRLFDACAQLCDTQDPGTLSISMESWTATLVDHINEDKQPESETLKHLVRELYYVVYQVKGTLLSAVLQEAARDLHDEDDDDE